MIFFNNRAHRRSRRWGNTVKYSLKQRLSTHDLKRRDRLFGTENMNGHYASFHAVPLKNICEAVKFGYLDPNDDHNGSPIVMRMIKFALQYQDRAQFYFSGIVHYDYGEEDTVIDTMIMKLGEKDQASMLLRFRAFCKNAEIKTHHWNVLSAWWD